MTLSTVFRRPTVRIVLGLAVVGAAAAAVAVLVFGVGAPGPATLVTQPDFRPGATAPCFEHQTDRPDSAYEGGSSAQTRSELTFLAYYTAAGRKPFCDGGRPTDVDKAWAQLYVQLTGNQDNVSTVLG